MDSLARSRTPYRGPLVGTFPNAGARETAHVKSGRFSDRNQLGGRVSPVGELTDELRSFLGERRYAVLATHDPDGGIRLTPIWFLFEDDRFYFASSSGSRKVKNLERSFSASVVVDAREPGRERWVSASGPVEILHNGEAQSINARIRHRYLAPKALDGPIEATLAASDDVTLSLAPTAWRSWAAPIVESPERWFLAVDA
jgi:PPOX class probable F420-dependent enzyme